MSDHDEQPEWDTFKWRYVPRGHFCGPCAERGAVKAWVRGEHEVTPPVETLRRELRFAFEAEQKHRATQEQLWALQRERHDEGMAALREARRRRQDPDPT